MASMNFAKRAIDLHVIDAPEIKYGMRGASEAVALQYRLKDTRINVVPHIVWDVDSLRAVIRKIANFRKTYLAPRKALPFLHIASGHGISDGLLIGDDVPLGWEALRDILAVVNTTTGHNLLISLSSCHSLHGYRMACDVEKQPFYLLVAPRSRRRTKVLVAAFARFYRRLLHDHDSIRGATAYANRTPELHGKVIEHIFGWEVRRAYEKIGVDDPSQLMRRHRSASA
jgi:hypothetical protein